MKNNRHIDFRALRVFAAVVESETLTQAAKYLGITQSAVSQAIKQLEAQTASELVIRRSRPINKNNQLISKIWFREKVLSQ